MIRSTQQILVVALTAAVALSACKKDAPAPVATTPAEPVATLPAPQPMPPAATPAAGAGVMDLQLGTSVGADNRVPSPTTAFGARDTLYASVNTTADATGALGARWTYLGSDGSTAPVEVETQTKRLTPGAATAHEFHISKPDGWPLGRYRVEITHDGRAVQTRDFDVR